MVRKPSETLIVVLHEIYGINNHIKGICSNFAAEDFDVVCPNLLDANQPFFDYCDEPIAYEYFMRNVGFNTALQRVGSAVSPLRKKYKHCFVVGYSIGATVAWLCSQYTELFNGAVGYYGSRIRDYKNIQPQCPVLLFLPIREAAFDINALIQDIGCKRNVNVVQVNAWHGFANPDSENYCKNVSSDTFALSLQFINNLLKKGD